jgi:hypothetical protein
MTQSSIKLPQSPLGEWEQLTTNEQAWIEFIRVISSGTDPRPTPDRVRKLQDLLDMG